MRCVVLCGLLFAVCILGECCKIRIHSSKRADDILFYSLKISATSTSAFRTTPRIIGGEKAQIEQFNWQTALLYESKIFCGGTIISAIKVVSAAHCVHKIIDVGPLQVRVGSVEWHKGGKLVNVLRLAVHPDYNEPTLLNNDVAVVILRQPLTFGPTIGHAILADNSMALPPGTMVDISGYGSTSLGNNNPNVLHYTAVPLVSPAKCKEAYKEYPGFAKLTEKMICAGFYGVGGKDTCNTDSGGMVK